MGADGFDDVKASTSMIDVRCVAFTKAMTLRTEAVCRRGLR